MSNHLPPVTVIGLGAMGSALARVLLRAGHPTTIWNRTAAKAEPLAAEGAIRAGTVAEAVAASPLVIACLLDHDSAHSVFGPVADDLSGRVLVNLTSGTPEDARLAAGWAADHGAGYLEGKILAVPSTIGEPEAFLLYSGPPEIFAAHEATLAVLGRPSHLGADPGLASLYDLGLLGLFYGSMTGYLHALAVLGAEGIDAGAFLPYANALIGAMPGIVGNVTEQVQTGKPDGGAAYLDTQVAYVEHIIEASEARGVDAAFPAYLKTLMDRAIAAGHGRDDLGRLVDEFALAA